MTRARNWMSNLILHTPAPLRSLRKLPVFGDLLHRISHRLLPAEEKTWGLIEVGPAKGLWLELNPRTGRNYLRGETESEVQRILEARLHSGMVFYDLGANIGLFTLLAARLVGASGKVFSFEPDPEVALRLRRNIERNGFQNITLVETGVWSASGQINFVTADPSSPDRGIGKFVAGEGGSSGKPIECVSLDDFMSSAPAPDWIKCDVEGAEVEVFHGAEKLLGSHRPWIICEMHSEKNNRDSREFLSGFGYSIQTVDANHILALPS